MDHLVSVARRLYEAGATMRAAHAAINRLAESGLAVCEIAHDADIGPLAFDLASLNVHVQRRREIAEPASFISAIRLRHGLSQKEFADTLGFDVRTLQNWEQGRNRPDAAVLNLVTLYDRSPRLVTEAAFEPVE